MKNPVLIVLSSALLVSFPAITATMSYEFTADGYMIAMSLAAFSVCLSRMEYIEKKHWLKLVISALCICCSCGIYQAYVSFAFVLAVCYFMKVLLENSHENKQYRNWITAQVLIYGFGLAAYFIIWKVCLHLQGLSASSYQGIDRVGVMNGEELVNALFKIARDFIRFFIEWNILQHGVTVYSVLNMLFLAAFATGLIAAVIKTGMLRRKGHLLLLMLCIIGLPVGCFIWYLTSPDVTYHALMLQSVSLLYIFAAVIYDQLISCRVRELVLVLLVTVVINNSVAANMCYNLMHQSFEKTYAAAVELSTRIHMLDDANVKYIAIYGGLGGYDQESYFAHDELRQLGGWKMLNRTILSPMFLSLYTDFNLSYYRMNDLEYPVVENEPNIPASYDWEFRFPIQNTAERERIAEMEVFRAMPVWPARDSVKVIGDTVVVKLSETASEPVM